MNNVSYFDVLKSAAPQAILIFFSLVVMLAGLAGKAGPARAGLLRALSAVGCLMAAFGVCAATGSTNGSGVAGILETGGITAWVHWVLLLMLLCSIAISDPESIGEDTGEYYALLLLSGAGMLFLASAVHLLVLFTSLELTSIGLYVLAAWDVRRRASTEAGLKYFLAGGVSAAFLLFGLSLIYGVTGSLELEVVATRLQAGSVDPMGLLGVLMVITGFGFKVAAVPFHLWAPDVYQGAPTPIAALVASGSKVASFMVLIRLMGSGFGAWAGRAGWHDVVPGWALALAVLAVLSMVLGNLGALAQHSVKRLVAYSAVSHAGYMLLGVLAGGTRGLGALAFYVTLYGFTSIGLFAVIGVVERASGHDRLEGFAGFSRRHPILAFCLLIFVLSLAGIPPLAGFAGKFFLFAALLKGAGASAVWLVVVAIGMSCVSLYYYLQVLKQAYVASTPSGGVASSAIVPAGTSAVIIAVALAVIVLGIWPDLLLSRLLPLP